MIEIHHSFRSSKYKQKCANYYKPRGEKIVWSGHKQNYEETKNVLMHLMRLHTNCGRGRKKCLRANGDHPCFLLLQTLRREMKKQPISNMHAEGVEK